MIKLMAAVLSVMAASATVGLSGAAQAAAADAMAGVQRVEGRTDRPVFFVGGLEPSLGAGEITASAGSRPLNVGTVTFESHLPTDFLVLIDVSRSTKAPADIRQVTNILIERMGREDRMEIATFGDKPFEREVHMTSDTWTLRDRLSKIQTTDRCTKLYQALSSAAARLHNRDLAPATTGRNAVLVVLSDGKDDDPDQYTGPQRGEPCNGGRDTLLLRAQNDMANAGVPLLFVDTTNDPLKLCKSDFATWIASRSDKPDRRGGQCVRLSDAADAVRTLTAVTRIETTCRDCPEGPQTYTLDIKTRGGGRLNLTREARLAPQPQPQPQPADPIKKSFLVEIMEQPWFLPLAGVLGIALLIGAVFFVVSLRSRRWSRSGTVAETVVVGSPREAELSDIEPNPPSWLLAPPNAEFVQLGHYGTEQRFLVAITEQPISLGRGDGCDIALTRDSAVADTQCEFVRDEGEVLVRNLAPNGLMLLAGAGIPAGAGWRRLRHGDVLRVGNTDLRFSDLERTV